MATLDISKVPSRVTLKNTSEAEKKVLLARSNSTSVLDKNDSLIVRANDSSELLTYLHQRKNGLVVSYEEIPTGGTGDLPADIQQQLNAKLNKITSTSANPRIYGVDETGSQVAYFATQTPNANTVPLRDASGRFQVEDGVAPKQAVNRSQLDSLSNFIAEQFGKVANLAEQNTFSASNTFTEEVQFNKGLSSDGNILITNAVLKVLNNSTNGDGTQKDYVTQYGADKILVEENSTSYTLNIPKKSGTLALTSDIPADKVPFKYSEFISSNDGDSWKLNDSTKNLELNYQDENSHSNLSLEKDYIEISGINGTGTAKISLASNVLTLDSEGTAGQHKLVRITPDKVTIGNSTDNSLIEIDSTSTKFNNRPQVRDNGNYVNVALADDLNNYAVVQSESADNYYAQLSNENGVISARIFQNGSDDAQNLTIDKTGVKVLGKKVATEDQLSNKLDVLYTHRLVSVVKINNVNYTLVANLISSKSDAYTSLEMLPTTRMEDMSATLITADSDGNEYKSQVAATYYTDGIFVSGVCVDSSATMTALQNNRTTVVTAIETYTPIKIN